MKTQSFFFVFLCWTMFGCWLRGLKVTKHLTCFQLLYGCHASYVTLLSKHVSPKTCHTCFYYTPPSTDWDSSNLGYLQGNSLATRLHTIKIEGFGGWLKRWILRSGPYNLSQNINIYLWLRTLRINKIDSFWALVNLVRENSSPDLMNVWNIWLSLASLAYQLHPTGRSYGAQGNLFMNRPRTWGGEAELPLLPANLWKIWQNLEAHWNLHHFFFFFWHWFF